MSEKPQVDMIEPKGVEGHYLENGLDATEHVDLNANLEAKIKNPLKGIPREKLMRDVEAFAHEKGLVEHIPILRRGALVAQNPHDFDDLSGEEALDEAEKKALHDEVLHRWRMPARLFLTIATCSIGAAVQGWDQTGSNGANIFFPAYYGIGGSTTRERLLVGLVNAGPYIGSAFIGCWLSDPINNWIGRRGVIFTSCSFLPLACHWFCILPHVGTAIGLPSTNGYWNGCKSFNCFGSRCSGYVMADVDCFWYLPWNSHQPCLAVFYHPLNWRLMLGAPFIPAVPLLCLIYLCPESPRWLMKKNRYAEAWTSMNMLRNNPIQVARDIYYIHAQLSIENQLTSKTNYVTRFTQLFTIPRVRRATIAAFTAMLCSFGFGLVNWLFAFPAFWTIDTFGRRSLLLFTFPQMMWTLLAAGLCTLMEQGTARTALVALFVFMFGAFYSPGEGPVPFTYSAEVFPLSHREVGMGFAVATCLFWAAVLSMTFPFILDRLHTVGAFGLYAGFNLVALIMIFFLVPETKQRTLEELDYVFAVPNRKFAKYQVTKALPYGIKRWVLFQRNAVLEPLYHKDDEDQTTPVREDKRASS
ncbi:putative polyol transporter 6 [Daldinia childiae]|uniref:putative polyol transporter 6 n=1 Tax=Daldinia childiae TaxID=326645 RepID=UPI001447021B|nr:putative polyol transporter 6 [Daldinia childiae]KAF3065381.1 putative polyol transporter 6 [Daldinia childiae]